MKSIVSFFFFLVFSNGSSQTPFILSQREQARVIDEFTEDRLKNLLPTLMRREGIDLWVIVSRENNEDPILKTMLPATWLAARRTTMLMIFDPGVGRELEYYAIARYDVGKIFKNAWNPAKHVDQWVQLAKLIEEKNPKKIAINKSEVDGHTDGLTSNDYDRFMEKLSRKFHQHMVSSQPLAIAWLETRTEKEMSLYPQIGQIAHQIIAEGFSEQVIHPGITTTDDVAWWYRERIKELKLDTWFHPDITVQRDISEELFSKLSQPITIMPGDLLHVDFGITYLRLNTDTQEHAYVLKAGEKSVPEYLNNAFKRTNKLQDILVSNFKEGKTGNQILTDSRKQAIDQGITPSIYTHPIGFHGHGSGTTIGMWDMQNGVPKLGDYPMHLKTAYSIELNATVYVIEWKKEIKIMLEEDGYFDENGFQFIDGRQTEVMQIPRQVK